MKPIKKGMTEAVTRDGRKVTQLTWFDGIDSKFCVIGVLNGTITSWCEEGQYTVGEHSKDIFAPVEYEWQWLIKHKVAGDFHVTGYRKNKDEAENNLHSDWVLVSRIEESKREVLTD